MAIGTDSAVWFYGTQDEVTVASPSSVTDGSMSVDADVDSWVNDDDAPLASFVLNAAWTTAPTEGTVVILFAQVEDIEGTNDSGTPNGSLQSIYLGVFRPDTIGSSTEQYLPLPDVAIPTFYTSQSIQFYILNETGQTINSGWDLYITPKTYGPHA